MRSLTSLRLLLAGGLATATQAVAQTAARTIAPPADTACPYIACALGIAPVWNGLAVVRGAGGERVATLGFFHARRLPASLFAGNDSAAAYAARAVRVRRVASTLTDAGALLLAIGGARAIAAGHVDGAGRAVLATGGVAFGASIPLQFAADGHLSRAVWWRNAPAASAAPSRTAGRWTGSPTRSATTSTSPRARRGG